MSTAYESEAILPGAAALLAARKAWEAMLSEVHSHEGDFTRVTDDVYLCLVCVRRAEELVAAMQVLGRYGRTEGGEIAMAEEQPPHEFEGEKGEACEVCGKPVSDKIHGGRIAEGAGTAGGKGG